MLSSIPVHLIRQWCYCPRVVYYLELTDFSVLRPTWVKQGEKFHLLEKNLWQRRNLSRFKISAGSVQHNLKLQDKSLGLHGVVDMAIETDELVYAVEFKLSANNKKRGDILQLVAYAMLLESHFGKPCSLSFLVGKGKVLHIVEVDSLKRQAVQNITNEIRQMLQHGMKPDSSASINQCCTCEYINFCNDRL